MARLDCTASFLLSMSDWCVEPATVRCTLLQRGEVILLTRRPRGASSTKTPEFTVPSGAKARLVYSMPEDGDNAITLYQAPDEYVDLLLNDIGPQSGSTRLYRPGTFYLDVMGAYTINVQVFKRPAA
jgi:hypothetical protein